MTDATPDSAPTAPTLARFLHKYYVLNAAAILSYGLLRMSLSSPRLLNSGTWTGLTTEQEVFCFCGVAMATKFRNAATIDEFIGKLFLVGKLGVSVLLFYLDKRILVLFILGQIALFVAVPQPVFSAGSDVTDLTPSAFRQEVSEPQTKAPKLKVWIVLFHADWCSSSVHMEPMFAKLAQKYQDKDRRFARLDIVQYPEVAEELNIDTTSKSSQLPTLAVFHRGREVCRLPTFDSGGKVVRARLDEQGVTKYFQLDKPLTETSCCGHKARAAAAQHRR